MNKKITMLLIVSAVCMLNSLHLTAQMATFEREAVLTETAVKVFINHHEALISDIKAAHEGSWLPSKKKNTGPRETLDAIAAVYPSKKIRTIFQQYGLNPETGHLQIAIIQYGIIALEIEEALTEVSAMKRIKREQEADKKVAAYLNELKSQINSADMTLIRTYRKQLRPIFDTGD